MKQIRDAQTFDELLDIKYGKLGPKKRDEFEVKAKAFVGNKCKKTDNQTDAIVINNNDRKDLAF